MILTRYQAPDYTKYKWFGKFAGVDRTQRVYQTNRTITSDPYSSVSTNNKNNKIDKLRNI